MSTTAGIDIGSEAIKGVVLKADKTGPVEVIGAGTMPIADLTRMPESQDRALAIGEKLKELVRSARLRAETRRVGASGGNTSIRYLQIPPVPPWRLEMLVKYEVEERAEEKEANCADFHIMDVPESNGQYTVIIGMCREGYANELLSQARSGGLGQIEIDLEALALYSAYYHGHGFDADKTVAVADIGADDLTVLICKNGALYYARTLLGGGRRFTQNLADDLKLEWSEADDLKKTSAEIVFDAPPPSASTTSGRPRLQRTGATLSIPRSSMPGKPGASAVVPGVQSPDAAGSSGVNPGGVPARSGVVPVPGVSGDESRRARVPDGPKMTVRPSPIGPAGPGTVSMGSQIKPVAPSAAPSGQSSAGVNPASSAATPGPAQTQKLPAATMKMSSELDFSVPSLEDLELDTTPVAPVKAAPVPVAPVAPATPKPVPVAAVAPAALDDFELQPIDDEKKDAPKSGSPSSLAATQYVAPPVPQGKSPAADTVDLTPVSDSAKSVSENTALAGGTAQDLAELSASSSTPAVADDKDKRKRQTTAALVREAAVLCAAVENVLLNAKQQAKQPQLKLDRLYITGGGSKLKGLPEFMGRRLRVEVQALEPLRNLSLVRLSPAAAEALRGEQHTLGVALGLALSDLRPGAFNFQLLPQAIKNRREFWARGAYHYYAAGAAALALGLLVYTPYKNTDALNENFSRADEAFKLARAQNEGVKKQEKENNELRHRLKTITDNVQSGDYFLNLLAELKSKNRIQDDIYLSSISTTMPAVVMAEADTKDGGKPTEVNKEPDSFLAQRRVYLRGFARGKQKEALIKPIQDFYDKLVPFPLDPDNPANLFKDIRSIWISKEDNLKDGLYLKEFVLEAYTAAAAKDATAKSDTSNPKDKDKKGIKKDALKPTTGKPTVPANPPAAVPANPPAVQPAIPRANPFAPQPPVVPAPTPPLVPAVRQNQPQPGQVEQPIQNVQPARPAPQPVIPGVPAQPVPAVPAPARPLVPAVPNNLPAVPEPKRKPVYVVPDEPAVAPEKIQKDAK